MRTGEFQKRFGRGHNLLFGTAFAALALLLRPGSGTAATITVNSFNQFDAGQCTITVAILSMNAGADQTGCTHTGTYGTSDTIVLSSGTYALTVADNGTNAYPVIQKAVTINGNGATLSRTVGNIAPFFRFLEVDAGGISINNVTMTGGNVPTGDGGALLCRSGPLTVSGATFSANTAAGGAGGAIHHRAVEAASISGTTFTNNTVSPIGNGGAILDRSSSGMTLTNVTFSGNTASGGNGGAVYDSSSGSLVFNGGSLTNNSVSPGGNGGGIFDSSSGGINITNVVFSGNSTGGSGGAIYDSSSGTGPVSSNCFVGNTATISGGGIFRTGSPALNAINNWWGSATGPSGAGPGTGDAVSANVTFSPFLTSPPSICAVGQPTNTPTNTPAGVATNTPTNTPTGTPTNTPTQTPTVGQGPAAVVPTLSFLMLGLLALALAAAALFLMRRS